MCVCVCCSELSLCSYVPAFHAGTGLNFPDFLRSIDFYFYFSPVWLFYHIVFHVVYAHLSSDNRSTHSRFTTTCAILCLYSCACTAHTVFSLMCVFRRSCCYPVFIAHHLTLCYATTRGNSCSKSVCPSVCLSHTNIVLIELHV